MTRPALSVILPAYREAENLRTLLPALQRELRRARIPAELIVVDDSSDDGTEHLVASLQRRLPVRLLQRPGKLGLSSAVLAGAAVSRAPLLAVMDADHSHPPEALPRLVSAMRAADVAIGSRLVPGGRIQRFPAHRMLISRGAAALARPLTSVKDPMSGMFVCRRSLLERRALDPRGFKILLELLVKARPERVVEVPITFRVRRHGHSKLGSRQIAEYVLHLCHLYAYRLR